MSDQQPEPQPQKKELTPEEIEEKERKKEEKKKKAQEEKAAREAKKKERLEARQKKDEKEFVKDPNDPCANKFGDREIIRSQCDPEDRFKLIYTNVKDLNESLKGKDVLIRARISNSRGKGKMAFVVLREGWATV